MTLQAAMLPFGMPFGLEHRVHDLAGAVFDSFTSSNAADRTTLRKQWLGRDARTFEGLSMVSGFSAGQTFDLIGHPTLGADGEYFVTKVTHSSSFPDAEETNGEAASDLDLLHYCNRFECLAIETPWRPDRLARKPRIYSVQTAKVTGPVGMDVYTDPYGRIKVRFPWDRADDSPAGDCTCWVRVSQSWAGHGSPAFLFIPRVGMEVVVSFVDGDPDRPLITGCVYNGENPTPGFLPAQATKSIIRTRTIPHGPGHNEISFEDAMGRERVHLRAQRDLDELVLNNHVTEVSHSQANYVGGDHYERVGQNQDLEVRGSRRLTIQGHHDESSLTDHQHTISGNAGMTVGGSYELLVEGGTFGVEVEEGEAIIRSSGPIVLEQNEEHFVQLTSEEEQKGVTIQSKNSVVYISEDKIELTIGDSSILMTSGFIQINNKTFPASGGGAGRESS